MSVRGQSLNPRISEWSMPRTDTLKLFHDSFGYNKISCDDSCQFNLDKGHYISVFIEIKEIHNG